MLPALLTATSFISALLPAAVVGAATVAMECMLDASD